MEEVSKSPVSTSVFSFSLSLSSVKRHSNGHLEGTDCQTAEASGTPQHLTSVVVMLVLRDKRLSGSGHADQTARA